MNSLRKYSKNRGAKLYNGRWHSALRGTPIYESWRGMKKRCLNPNHTAYHNYGGRGITICNYLLDSPEAIIDCIGDRPKNMTLDRIDNNGHYSCGMCIQCGNHDWRMNLRWATKSEQARNARFNKIVTIDGVSRPACEWAEILGIDRFLFYGRLKAGKTGINLTGPLQRIRKK